MQSLHAIADPTRRRIVELLAVRERSAGELVAEFEMSAPAISQHLKVLREAGLAKTLRKFAGELAFDRVYYQTLSEATGLRKSSFLDGFMTSEEGYRASWFSLSQAVTNGSSRRHA